MCLVNRETMKDFRSSACWREVLKAAMTQLLLYYTRMLELLKRVGPERAAIVRDAVTIPPSCTRSSASTDSTLEISQRQQHRGICEDVSTRV